MNKPMLVFNAQMLIHNLIPGFTNPKFRKIMKEIKQNNFEITAYAIEKEWNNSKNTTKQKLTQITRYAATFKNTPNMHMDFIYLNTSQGADIIDSENLESRNDYYSLFEIVALHRALRKRIKTIETVIER